MKHEVMSYGGGVNSAAMVALIILGKLPAPDIAIIADTGREASSTWQYLEDVIAPQLKSAGVELVIAPHSLAKVDLYAHNGDMLLPMFTQSGKLPTFCSNEWKAYVVNRQLRKMGVKRCDLWIGYSLSEVERVKSSRLKWQERKFPLLDNGGLTRQDCITITKQAGLSLPEKSACWCCPNRANAEWRTLRDKYQADWQQAIDLEQQLRERDNQIWLHRDKALLPDCNIDIDNRVDSTQCGMGLCFV